MGLFEIFTKPQIDAGVAEFERTPGAILLDVRTEEEYAAGHIGGSCNLPLHTIVRVEEEIPDKNTPLFVHCRSGARSGQAVSSLKRMGYRNVRNIGGIMDYHGKVER